MANAEHLAVLAKGISAWNEWHKENRIRDRDFRPDLSGADLQSAKLANIDLLSADLCHANLTT